MQQDSLTLDTLLDTTEPHGTFHDALLQKMTSRDGCIALDFNLCVGAPDAVSAADRERRRAGVLLLYGVHNWTLDPPDTKLGAGASTWLTADGPTQSLESDFARSVANSARRGSICHFLYFSDSNAFLYWSCDGMEFSWFS